MKTTYLTLEIKHTKPLPDDYETTIANRAYGYFYARGCECGVQPVRIHTSSRDFDALHLDGGDQQNVFLASSQAIRDDLAGTPR